MIVLSALLALAASVALVIERRDHRSTIARLNEGIIAEREEWRRERGVLLNRIKPETAQAFDGEALPSLPAVGFDDDAAWWRARGIAEPAGV